MNRTAFAGHRKILDKDLRNKLYLPVKQQIESGCKTFVMGTHGEFDKLALSVCRQLRKTYKDIIIEVAITSLNQIKPEIEKDQFGISKYTPYDDVYTIMFNIEEEHFKRKITTSNKQMIDTCNILICYVDTTQHSSGAKTTLNYAKSKGIQIINLFET